MFLRILVFGLLFWLPVKSALAGGMTFINVPGDFRTIQEAIESVEFGAARILVAPGVYRERIHFRGKAIQLVSFDPDDVDIIATTVIDANFRGGAVKFSGTETDATLLSGFTIRNGRTNKETDQGFCPGIDGGSPGTKARIEKNIITGNISEITVTGVPPFQTVKGGFGGGIRNCHGVISSNFITGNISQFGGAGITGCSGIIEKNFINGNTSLGPGGGLFQCEGIIRNNPQIWLNVSEGGGGGLDSCIALIEGNNIAFNISRKAGGGINNCDGTIKNNLIHSNTGLIGGGGIANADGNIFQNWIASNGTFDGEETFQGGGIWNCRAKIFNNFILYNVAEQGAGLADCSGPIVHNTILYNDAVTTTGGIFKSSSLVQNNILWGNDAPLWPQIDPGSTTPTFCLVQDWEFSGFNNITSQPLFLESRPDDPTKGNYRLLEGSPGIDAGGIIGINQFTLDIDNELHGHDGDGLGKNAHIGDGSDIDIGADEAFHGIAFIRHYIFGFYDWELPVLLEMESDANSDGEINIMDLQQRLRQ